MRVHANDYYICDLAPRDNPRYARDREHSLYKRACEGGNAKGCDNWKSVR